MSIYCALKPGTIVHRHSAPSWRSPRFSWRLARVLRTDGDAVVVSDWVHSRKAWGLERRVSRHDVREVSAYNEASCHQTPRMRAVVLAARAAVPSRREKL